MAASLCRPATELLVQYARYHRDPRNIASHFLGIPLIVLVVGVLAVGVLAVGVLLARLEVAGISAAWLAWALSTAWYLSRGNLALGVATSTVNAGLMAAAHPLAAGPVAAWLGWGIGLFVLGWAIQFVGHWWEGRKPAFVDDVVGLLVGPMFVVAEWLIAAGWNRPLAVEIERRAGPARRRVPSAPAA